MSKTIDNPRGIDAVVFFKGKNMRGVVPDLLEVDVGQPVEWEIASSESVIIHFENGRTPFKWDELESDNGKIKGTIESNAKGIYKYSVSDVAGNITIDPRIRIKK